MTFTSNPTWKVPPGNPGNAHFQRVPPNKGSLPACSIPCLVTQSQEKFCRFQHHNGNWDGPSPHISKQLVVPNGLTKKNTAADSGWDWLWQRTDNGRSLTSRDTPAVMCSAREMWVARAGLVSFVRSQVCDAARMHALAVWE